MKLTWASPKLTFPRRIGTTPPAEGQRVRYDFVKPHADLEGQIPAERAGLRVKGENK